jgi:jumonji domain-containing protein 7
MSYQELNEEQITELHEPPSPLEFLRYVHRNRPFIIRGGAREWPAVQRWTANYLQTKLRDCSVKVAITPDGYLHFIFATYRL